MNRTRYWLALVMVAAFPASCEKPVSQKRFQSPEGGGGPTRVEAGESADGWKDMAGGPKDQPPGSFEDLQLPETDSVPLIGKSERERLLEVRRNLIGRYFVNLQVGEWFLPDARIRRIDDSGVQIQFRNGIAAFTWAELPESYRRNWGYDPDREIKMVRESEDGGLPLQNPKAIEAQ